MGSYIANYVKSQYALPFSWRWVPYTACPYDTFNFKLCHLALALQSDVDQSRKSVNDAKT